MYQGKLFPSGGFFIGIEGNPPDKFTNENIYAALQLANISTEFEVKEYKGEKVRVWRVTSKFISDLYNSKKSLPLKFIVYEELNYIFQRFQLFDPYVRKKARQGQILARQMKKIKERRMAC